MISISSRARSRALLVFSALVTLGSFLLSGCGGGSNGGGGCGSTCPVQSYTITVDSSNPASGVTITYSNPSASLAASGTTSFTLSENSGTTLTFVAPVELPNGNTFSNWSGGCTSTSNNTCTVTVTGNVTITANYSTPVPTVYTLTIDSTDPATGVAITASPADNNKSTGGNTAFTLSYNSGTQVTLTAPGTLSNGNTFTSWTGCASPSGQTCTVTLSANTTVTANYTTPPPPPTNYTITVDSSNPASGVSISYNNPLNNVIATGTTSFTITEPAGTTINFTAPATAPNNNTFNNWTGCTTPSGTSCSVTVSANTTITANYSTPAPTVYLVTVNSTTPASGATITASPADNSNISSGTTPLTLRYNAGTSVTLIAASTAGGNGFSSWTGCSTASSTTCTLASLAANATVTAAYSGTQPAISISPGNNSNVTIGSSQQFTATTTGGLTGGVTWTVAAPQGATQSPGTISTSGLYESPYPAPASVTVTATSTSNTSVSQSITINLVAPATAAGPALSIDAGTVTHAISPLIYGMNAYLLDPTTAANANITVTRWGGDDTSRYNYQNGYTNSASDYYFQNSNGAYGMLPNGANNSVPTNFNDFLTETNSLGIQSIATANVLGYVTNNSTSACSFPKSSYPNQQSYNSANCGNGIYPQGTNGCTTAGGCSLFGNPNATPPTWQTTSLQEPPPTAPGASNNNSTWATGTWTGSWISCLLNKGTACASANGKDATIWDLDNEPAWWDAVHRDVHPSPSTYDEVTNGGIGTAVAIKTLDPNAKISGPVIDYWWNYFYSKKDIENGWSTGPCYQPWSGPTDRQAHGGVPMIVYYLQQMSSASDTYGIRLLDYLTIHSYSAANYNGASVGLTTTGDTGEQQVRMNSTRALWDPTYTDPNFPQPNYTTDANYYTKDCNVPLQAPQVIPMMQSWITSGWTTANYPAPGISIDEYNFGGTDSINGAVTQADVLGIFGKYGLTMGVFWPTSGYATQAPGNVAFEIYRNYDGNKSTFGDSEISSSSVDQSKLSVYAGVRSSDSAVTIVVINKTYGPLTSTLSINNLPSGATTAHVYQYTDAQVEAKQGIQQQSDLTITPPTSGTTSTVSATFPGQSITLLVIPQ